VLADWRTAPLEPADRTLAEYAVALTRDPAGPAQPRLDALRAAGFPDEALLQATEIAAYFNFVNRLADGLGVILED
jgi:alkylhydroperoxidase family enzyme